MNKLTTEIFAVGKWNGYSFSLDDLKSIAANFSHFSNLLKVPLKFGHNDEQPLTDGQPALGWVERVWLDGEKLMAEFSDVPQIVMDAVKKKLYRKVSIELDIDVENKGKLYNYVLSGVALLGADIPAVSTLSDLTKFMSRSAAFSAGRKLNFEAIAGVLNEKGATIMDLQQLSEKVAALTTQVADLTAKNSELTLSKAEVESKLAKLEADAEERDEAEKKAAMSAKRADVVKVFDDAIKAGSITPVQKASFSKVLRIEDDAALTALDLADVKAMIGAGSANFSASGSGMGSGSAAGASDDDGKTPAEIVVERARKLMAADASLNFAAAQTKVFEADKDLARRYLTANDKE